MQLTGKCIFSPSPECFFTQDKIWEYWYFSSWKIRFFFLNFTKISRWTLQSQIVYYLHFFYFFSLKSDYSTTKAYIPPYSHQSKIKWSFHKSKRIICLCSINFFILQTDARRVFHYAVSHCFRLLMLTINLILYGPIGNNPLF